MKTTTPRVCITTCPRCSHEETLFRPAPGACPCCGNAAANRIVRWIAHPHPDTVAKARDQELMPR